jgi:cytochrome c oxidase subunit 3
VKTQKKKLDLRQEAFKRMEQMHPHQILLYVSMIGSGVIFLFMIVAFTVSMPAKLDFLKIEFPKSFILSTLVLLSSSFTVARVYPAYLKDDIDEIKKWLGITFLLGLLFSVLQFTGWQELQAKNILFNGERSGAYLYVISGMHVIHMAGVLVFALYLLMEAHRVSKDVVKHLMYSTNPYQKIKFRMLNDFWHFVDVLWLLLFIYFLFTF